MSKLSAAFEHLPRAPRTTKDLAQITARLCRLLRDEVMEQLARGTWATDWRESLFPDATDEGFADAYAQVVTFGLLMARATGIELAGANPPIGAALELLLDAGDDQAALGTALATLVRVIDGVDWSRVSKGQPDAWLYFYEDFLEVYDNELRKKSGSYYTPPDVVDAMVRLVDDVLRSDRFQHHAGIASPTVTLVDPAAGTGTFLLGVLRRIAETATEAGDSVAAAIAAAVERIRGFELQLGPSVVAQLRILAELVDRRGALPKAPLRVFVTNTLADPSDPEPITVVIGNPPYKEKAKGEGGWIEGEPLDTWMPPREWQVGAHAKHLHNLYVYFWRWATWKVFDQHPTDRAGIICYITVAGFLAGPGFQKMRDYLRRTCDDIWVIDCTPEGHQPDVSSRIFQAVQQPLCIVLASRSGQGNADVPAKVRFHSLPVGHRAEKLRALGELSLGTGEWTECPADWRAPFRPADAGAWATYPALADLFSYSGAGVMPGRTWIIAPDTESLIRRWGELVAAPEADKAALFHPHLRGGKPGDRHVDKVAMKGLPGYAPAKRSVARERGACLAPVRYGYRSFDRQWIIPDNRLINQPNPQLWALRSDAQIFMTALLRESPTAGPALTFTACIPDHDHYKGSFGGRVYPLWRDPDGDAANFSAALLMILSEKLGRGVEPGDLFAYIAGTAAHPAFTARFQRDLSTPGLRIPISADAATFAEAVAIGQLVIWLHTFGERMVDPAQGRPEQPPRLSAAKMPRIPPEGAILSTPAAMPDAMDYDPELRRLHIGGGHVDNVDPAVWRYEVSGKQVLSQWFSYRKQNRRRPIIGDRRRPSRLGSVQPDHWLPEYTRELIDVLNVLGWLVELEPRQAAVLEKICAGPTIGVKELEAAGALRAIRPTTNRRRPAT